MQEMQAPSLGQEDPLGKEMTTHSSVLAWEIPWTEDPGSQERKGKIHPTEFRVPEKSNDR